MIFLAINSLPWWGARGAIRLSMLTHIYPNKPLMKWFWQSAITRLTDHYICVALSDTVIWKIRKKYGHA